jgi:dTDP-4-amino-4,6-dideoxygalactose transaminase
MGYSRTLAFIRLPLHLAMSARDQDEVIEAVTGVLSH